MPQTILSTQNLVKFNRTNFEIISKCLEWGLTPTQCSLIQVLEACQTCEIRDYFFDDEEFDIHEILYLFPIPAEEAFSEIAQLQDMGVLDELRFVYNFGA